MKKYDLGDISYAILTLSFSLLLLICSYKMWGFK